MEVYKRSKEKGHVEKTMTVSLLYPSPKDFGSHAVLASSSKPMDLATLDTHFDNCDIGGPFSCKLLEDGTAAVLTFEKWEGTNSPTIFIRFYFSLPFSDAVRVITKGPQELDEMTICVKQLKSLPPPVLLEGPFEETALLLYGLSESADLEDVQDFVCMASEPDKVTIAFGPELGKALLEFECVPGKGTLNNVQQCTHLA
jgi:hypothetical protein